MDYGAKAAGHVDVFMEANRWSNAQELFRRVSPA
jgi:hypothetical protein